MRYPWDERSDEEIQAELDAASAKRHKFTVVIMLEYEPRDDVPLTSEQIKKFEKDTAGKYGALKFNDISTGAVRVKDGLIRGAYNV